MSTCRFNYKFFRQIALDARDLPPGAYNVAVKLYWYVDQKPLPVDVLGHSSGNYYVIQSVTVG